MFQQRLTRALLTCLVISSLFFLMSTKSHRVGAAPALPTTTIENDSLGVYIPNAFSPNEDGVNDDFGPYFRPDLTIEAYQLQVFDRWGVQMFISNDPSDRWNGTYRGEIAEPGAYAYALAVTFAGETGPGPKVMRGNINLVR
ncbi:gliding motility-associated C-terminal domain-containing protein [Lewinella sp. W8]|uniref:T9SS type B sorting domain-containing protein n=1 Tax=Lewinella sp. W8 TaxID=2528208 RepID=UPI001067D518|nr:gliding motility-associated C-terminal domain-containing protein [Lewinella sp. W8]MTB53724.1 T9SS type B sorting domain-containing protein [Lewinella sp. W8]